MPHTPVHLGGLSSPSGGEEGGGEEGRAAVDMRKR